MKHGGSGVGRRRRGREEEEEEGGINTQPHLLIFSNLRTKTSPS